MRAIRVFALLLNVVAVGHLLAQTNAGAISGAVFDPSGAVVPEVQLTIQQENTSAERIVHSDPRGRYVVQQLVPGPYRISARHEGFQTEIREGIVVTVGQETVANIRLKLGAIASEIAVRADTEMVDTRTAAVSGLMNNQFIRDLPLNGRDLHQLALLEPGIVMTRRGADSGSAATKLVANGSRPSQNSFLLDGSDINDATNTSPGSVAGGMLGVDTLQEFRVFTNAYSAAYGRSAGGVISAVTKSGTNRFRGSAFEFIRNSTLDAKNYFDSASAPIPPFKRNQFGVEVDGPILRDKTFFMASYEGLRQRLGVTSIAVVPGDSARQGKLPGQAAIAVNPVVIPYLNLVPLPNGPLFADGTGQFINAASQSTDENFATARIDHRFTDMTSVFVRYSHDSAISSVPDNLNLTTANSSSRNQYLAAEAMHIFNERLLNTFRFSFNKSLVKSFPSYQHAIDPSLSFLPGAPLGQISITGLFSLGPSRFGPSFLNMKLFQFSDNITYTRGRHSLNVGGDYRFYHLPAQQVQSPYGFYQFSSLSNFLKAVPSSVEMTLPSSQLVRNWRQSMVAAYVQDEVRLGRRLTLNAGLRYERVSEPDEEHGLLSNLRNLSDSQAAVGRLFVNPSNLNLAPRVGVAWDPFGDGKTSVRSGFGIFYSQLWSDFYYNAGNRQPPFYTLGSISSPVFPNAFSLISSPRFVLGRQDVVQYQPASPYAMQYNFTVQRQLAAGSVLTVGYTGERGVHQPRLVDGNQALPTILSDGRYFFAPNSPVQNPNFTGIRYKKTDGMSYYNALMVTYEQRLMKRLLLRANYTFSRNIDTGSLEITQGTDNDLPQNPYSLAAERGLSNYDVRHYFVSYWTWDLPSAPGPKWLGAGWQWNTITTLASGNPFSAVVSFDRAGARFQSGTSPERPDLVPGASTNPILGGASRYFDPNAFALPAAGFYGNVGRNTLIGPGLVKVDVSLNKHFQLTERLKMEFRTEVFNILNHPNFSIPSQRAVFSGVNSTTGQAVRVASAGLITSTQTSSRQLQMGLKINF
ncbi:MAG: TonB-dependent receptor [Acidobacteriia bacterium]|nr:TonB-dependent receptor [Terriglobia bacterium]